MKHKKIRPQFGAVVVTEDQGYVSIYCDSVKHEGTIWGVRTYTVWPSGSFIAAHYYLNPDGSTHRAQINEKTVTLPEDEQTEGWGHRNLEHLECHLCGRAGSVDVRSERFAPILAKCFAAGVSELSLSALGAILKRNRKL